MSSTPYTDTLIETVESCRDASLAGIQKSYEAALEYISDGRYSEALVSLEKLKAIGILKADIAIRALTLAATE